MKPAANLWFIGGVLNIISNYFVIRVWGAYGAAITNCLSFGFIYFGVMWKSIKLFKLNLAWKKLLGGGIVVLICGVVMSPPWHSLSAGKHLPEASNIFWDFTMFDLVDCTKLGASV